MATFSTARTLPIFATNHSPENDAAEEVTNSAANLQTPMPTPSPSEILAERISDVELSRSKSAVAHEKRWEKITRQQRAFNRAGLIAIHAVKSAAAAGNVQCHKAEMEIDAFLEIILQEKTKP